MTTCPAKTVYTPDRAADVFARSFPRFCGVLDVRSTAPAGKGGRLLKDKRTTFFVSSGISKKTLTRKLKTLINAVRDEHYRNGLCPVCGKLYLSPLIGWMFDSNWLSLEACPTCLSTHKLLLDSTRFLTGTLSPLATFDIHRVDVVVDIRAVQAGYNTDWTITWTPGPASEPYLMGGSSAAPVSASTFQATPLSA